MVGRKQKIEIGFMSGASNVTQWLAERGIQPDKDLIQDILAEAKAHTSVLTEEQVLAVVRRHAAARS